MVNPFAGVAGELGRRSTFIGLMPGAALAAYVAGLVAAGAPGRAPDASRFWDRAGELSGAEGGVLLVVLVVATVLTQPLQLPLVRLLEGYSLPAPLQELGRARQAARRGGLVERTRLSVPRDQPPSPEALQGAHEVAWELAHRFPPEELLLPTRLGNVLRAAEHRAGAPYGFDAVTVWPRLYTLLGDDVRAMCDDRRLQLDVAVRFCAVFLLAAAASVALLWQHGSWLLSALAALVLARVAYASAVSAARAYGESIEVAFDLHHLDLFEAVHLLPPESTADERKLASQVTELFQRVKLDTSLTYDAVPPAAPTGGPAQGS